jgi:hypothetical protein
MARAIILNPVKKVRQNSDNRSGLLASVQHLRVQRRGRGGAAMKQVEHRGHVIHYTVENTEFWNARGRIEFYESNTNCSVNLTGKVNKFISEEEAEQDFLSRAKDWIDRHVGNNRPLGGQPL